MNPFRHFIIILFCALSLPAVAGLITHDPAPKSITLTDKQGDLVLTLNCDHACYLSAVKVRGHDVVAPETGVCTGIKDTQWITTRSGIPTPNVAAGRDTVTVKDILYSTAGVQVRETWRFSIEDDRILWRIDRDYLTAGTIEDTCYPRWNFKDMDTWTGGLLDNGGVAWTKYLETPNATFGTHADTVTFWNRSTGDCLRVAVTDSRWPKDTPAHEIAARFSHQPGNEFSYDCVPATTNLVPKHGLRRFLSNRQDVWKPVAVAPGKMSIEFCLQALDYNKEYGRGNFKGIREETVRELMNTIGRYGVIDRGLFGGNGWRSGYVCLHEQWFAQFGLALADPDYIKTFADTLDYERDHAITPEGRVKSRWHHDAGDAQRGTYDANGFYEAQWGLLLDSQPCYVINVAEEFDLTGDQQWLKGQKTACERALDYLLRRDSAGDGLVEMLPDYHTQNRASDWIDIIWASYKNALVNAELYYALTRWAESEDLLGDAARATAYRQAAEKLKSSFNRTIDNGGFWDPKNQWYAYWRDKDNSIHGDNLVIPVNFSAIAYGLCDDPARQRAILDRIEQETQRENLFFWPLNIFPYQPDEGAASNFPFPKYENGDIFLSWGELGVRSYLKVDPAIAVKYIKNVLNRYETDGLSFQRYLRQSQQGSGDDILAGNCSMAVALYRDIYGIQPRHDRLYLEPHLTPDLSGTQVKYLLRGQIYWIGFNTNEYAIEANAITIRSPQPFAVNAISKGMEFFIGPTNDCSLSLTRPGTAPVEISIGSWPEAPNKVRRWTERSAKSQTIHHTIRDLQPGAKYQLTVDGQAARILEAGKSGRVEISTRLSATMPKEFALTQE